MKKFFVGRFIILLSVSLLFSACENSKDGPSKEEYTEFKGVGSKVDQKVELLKSKLFDDPENFQLLSALGDLHFESERYKEALEIYGRALKVNPKSAETMNEMALSYFYSGDSKKALDSAKKAVEAEPKYKNARLTIGFINMTMGNFQEAEKHLKKLIAMDPGGNFAEEAKSFLSQIELAKGQK